MTYPSRPRRQVQRPQLFQPAPHPASDRPACQWKLEPPSYAAAGLPRVLLELVRVPSAGAPATDGSEIPPYEPLKVPESARLVASGPLLQTVRSMDIEATARLEPGIHSLPLVANATPLQIEVAPATIATLQLSLGRDSNEKSALRFMQLDFSPALRVSNLVAAGFSVSPLLEDALQPDQVPLWKSIPPALRLAVASALRSVDIAVGFEIDRIGLTEEPVRGERCLVPLFNGSMRLLDTVRLPLDALPWVRLLPTLPTDVERLLSPFMGLWAGLPAGPLSHALSGLMRSFDVRLRADLLAPMTSLAYRTSDNTRRQIDIQLAEPVQVTSTLSAIRREGQWSGRADRIEVNSPAGQAQLKLRFAAAFDDPSGVGQPSPRAKVDISVETESHLPAVHVTLTEKNPLCRSEAALDLLLENLLMHGVFGFELTPTGFRPVLEKDASLEATLGRDSSSFEVSAGATRFSSRIDGDLSLALKRRSDGLLWLIDYRGELDHEIDAQLTPIAELDVHDGGLRGRARTRTRLKLRPCFKLLGPNAVRVDLEDSSVSTRLYDFCLELDRRQLTLPGGSELTVRLRRGGVSPRGLLSAALDLHWDLQGEPCLLHFGRRATSLLTAELRQGELTLHLGESGKLAFSGAREGLYGVRYFNALLNPAGDLGEWLEIFQSDDAVRHVVDAVAMFSEELAERIRDARTLVMAAHAILKREAIKAPRDVIPRPMIARIVSLFINGDESLVAELLPIIQHATEGHGLPLAAAKHLVHRELGDFGIDFEIDMLLNWLHLVLRSGDLLEVAVAHEEPPLCANTDYTATLAALPSAKEIYAWVDQGLSREQGDLLLQLAPELSAPQLAHVLEHAPKSLGVDQARLFRRIYDLKHRIAKLGAGYGGIEHAMQSFVIGTFIGDAVGPLAGLTDDCGTHDPCALGPEDVAHLLQIGLARGFFDLRTQLSHHLLLQLLAAREADFTRHVLIELGHQSPRALSGILFAFLEQDQGLIERPIDLVELLSTKLGLDVPRHGDFLAGGRRARESYYAALDKVAQQIISSADPYLARKQHLRDVRHPAPPPVVISGEHMRLEAAAREAIARADRLGNDCVFDGKRRGPQGKAREAYRLAFARCAELLEQKPRAFQLDWFKQFWARNEQALLLLAAVRAHEQDLDRVRYWLATQTGYASDGDAQQLLAAFATALLYRKTDRTRALADPLTRLLIDPEPGRYDFSIITCMGVITEGQDGRELEESFRRLTRQRGIRVLRSHTGTGRSLEYNAAKIVEVIENCRTPWGIIGYSQGCANALLAESVLYSGTPAQQRLLEQMVGRLLLFSAANGSAHGSRGMSKFSQAMVAGERWLKHYQATMSWEAIRIALSAFRSVLDSPAFVDSLGGGDSLSFERAYVLHRDGQFLPHIPTSTARAVVEANRLPECLEYLYYCLADMTGGGAQDTQVLLSDAVGHATRVANDQTRAFARCDVGSPALAWHHWAPLTHEVEFVSTERDRKMAIYDGPKDCLIWPWVETNARFGRIRRKEEPTGG